MENHSEIKDACDGLETHLDEIAIDIRDLPFDYKIIEKYNSIDDDIQKLYKWYDGTKKILKRYLDEKVVVENKLKQLETKIKFLNNQVQNLKLQKFSRAQHAYEC